MKKLRPVPPNAVFAPLMFADGEDGMFIQSYRNNQYGVSVSKSRDSRKDPIITAIVHDDLEETFEDLNQLNAAIEKHNAAITGKD